MGIQAYRLFITKGQGAEKRVLSENLPLTQKGLCNAEEIFEQARNRADVYEVRLYRQDAGGMKELKRWVRRKED